MSRLPHTRKDDPRNDPNPFELDRLRKHQAAIQFWDTLITWGGGIGIIVVLGSVALGWL